MNKVAGHVSAEPAAGSLLARRRLDRAKAEAMARWYERPIQRPDARSARNAAICRAWGRGISTALLAVQHGTSRQRIDEILHDGAKGAELLASLTR